MQLPVNCHFRANYGCNAMCAITETMTTATAAETLINRELRGIFLQSGRMHVLICIVHGHGAIT